MEKNKKMQQDKKVAYDLKVAEVGGNNVDIPSENCMVRNCRVCNVIWGVPE